MSESQRGPPRGSPGQGFPSASLSSFGGRARWGPGCRPGRPGGPGTLRFAPAPAPRDHTAAPGKPGAGRGPALPGGWGGQARRRPASIPGVGLPPGGRERAERAVVPGRADGGRSRELPACPQGSFGGAAGSSRVTSAPPLLRARSAPSRPKRPAGSTDARRSPARAPEPLRGFKARLALSLFS